MPHKCIGCGKIFEKSDEAILDGCPACGSNRFLFIREVEKLPEDETDLDLVKEEQEPEKLDEIIDRIEEKMDDDLRLESVRIIEPGSYEVNIESLLERDEIILALKGDGSYVIHLPSMFARLKGGRKHK